MILKWQLTIILIKINDVYEYYLNFICVALFLLIVFRASLLTIIDQGFLDELALIGLDGLAGTVMGRCPRLSSRGRRSLRRLRIKDRRISGTLRYL